MDAPRVEGDKTRIRFVAVLDSSRGERLWRVEGRSEAEARSFDGPVLVDIARNVVSALIHDGWVQPRYDPGNPPPQPPTVRTEPR